MIAGAHTIIFAEDAELPPGVPSRPAACDLARPRYFGPGWSARAINRRCWLTAVVNAMRWIDSSPIADPRLAAENQHGTLSCADMVQHPFQRGALVVAAAQHPG